MSKSRISPRDTLFQLVIRDFKHRHMPHGDFYVDKSGNGVREIVETVPVITKLKWAKGNEQAKRWGERFGSVIACFKVKSHEHKLNMIEHLRLEPRPIEIDVSAGEFVVGKGLEIKPVESPRKIDVNGT